MSNFFLLSAGLSWQGGDQFFDHFFILILCITPLQNATELKRTCASAADGMTN